MPLSPKQRADKIEKMLEQHEAIRRTGGTHLGRLVDTLARMDAISDELDMNVQHRAVTDDLRETVSEALREAGALHDRAARAVALDTGDATDEAASSNSTPNGNQTPADTRALVRH